MSRAASPIVPLGPPPTLPSSLPDPRDEDIFDVAMLAGRAYFAAREVSRLDDSEAWKGVDDVVFHLAALHAARLETRKRLDATARPRPTWCKAEAAIAEAARIAYDTLVLTIFAPNAGSGVGYGARNVPPAREDVYHFVREALAWAWLQELHRASRRGDGDAGWALPRTPSPPRRVKDANTPHAVLQWRTLGRLGLLVLRVHRTSWAWTADFSPAAAERAALIGPSPLLGHQHLPYASDQGG